MDDAQSGANGAQWVGTRTCGDYLITMSSEIGTYQIHIRAHKNNAYLLSTAPAYRPPNMTDCAFRDLLKEYTELKARCNKQRAEIYSLRVDLAKARDVITNRDRQVRTLSAKGPQIQLLESRHQHELAEYARNEQRRELEVLEAKNFADACDDLKRLLHSSLESRENLMAENARVREELAEVKRNSKGKKKLMVKFAVPKERE